MTKVTHTITDFQRVGITDQLRGANGFGMIAGFDTTRAERLQPTQDLSASTHATEGTFTDAGIKAFALYGAEMYALGKSGSYPALHKWVEANSNFAAGATFGTTGTSESVIQAYKTHLYGAMKGTHIWRGEPDGSPVPNVWQAQSYTNFADIVHHQADDILYFLFDNYIASWDGSTYTAAALTLPTTFLQTSGTQAGDYLLSAGYDTNTFNSTIFWWNRDGGLDTVTAKNTIDKGIVKLVMRTGGAPIAITLIDGSGVVEADAKHELRVYSLSLSGATLVNRIEADSITVGKKWEYDDRAYFGLTITKDGTTYRGMAQIDEKGRITLEYEATTASQAVSAVARSGGQTLVHTADNSVFHTDNTYDDAKVVETRMYRAKKLTDHVDFVGATIYTEPLPASATLTLKYRTTDSASWTTLATWSTDDDVEHSITKRACTTTPSITPEMQFRVESSGNAVINGIQITLDEVNKAPYAS